MAFPDRRTLNVLMTALLFGVLGSDGEIMSKTEEIFVRPLHSK